MASQTGNVELTILDGGASVVVPSNSVQAVIGTCSSGTANLPAAFRNVNSLVTAFGYGPAVEAAALVINAGGTVIFTKAATTTAGAQTSVTATSLGTSVLTVTGNAFDTYQVQYSVVTGGTIGVAGITFRISLDAGRTFGPVLALGTANTYAIPNTGLTLNFAAGTQLANGYARFSTTEPLWAVAGVQAALSALQASTFATSGWSSMHIVGVVNGANAATIQGYLATMATQYIYTRAMMNARDAAIPTVWGGAGETEAAWTSAVITDFASLQATRLCVNAGNYNMPSAIPNAAAGTPRYRRPLSFALAARQVAIPVQRHAGRVKDGALANIVIDPTVDPSDGFVYHDERSNPNFDGARFSSATTRIGYGSAFYIKNPQLMSQLGSVFTMLYLGNVMDVGCTIATQIGQRDINNDVRLNDNGTIFENEAKAIESNFNSALRDGTVATQMLSNVAAVIDRTNNVRATSVVNVAVTLFQKGYILQENVSITFASN